MLVMNLADANKPERVQKGPIVALLWALLGRRPEDKAVQKRAARTLGWLSGGGFAIYAAVWGFEMVKSSVANERADHRQEIGDLVAAIKESAAATRGLAAAIEAKEKQDAERHQMILQQLSERPIPARRYEARPEKR